jgi:hypothetical protein
LNGIDSWTELKIRFGNDYKLAKRILLFEYIIFFLIGFWFLTPIEIDLFYPIVVFLILMTCLDFYGNKKINMRETLKGSQFRKKIDIPLRILFALIVFIGAFIDYRQGAEELKTKPIDEAIADFGYDVELPTYIPFEPTETYGWIDNQLDQLEVSYQYGFSANVVIYVSPQKPHYFKGQGERIALVSDTIGYYSENYGELGIYWVKNGLYYSMLYNSESASKSEILKIANSFK